MNLKLTSKERVKLTLARQQADRVPINYLSNAGIHARLKEHFGLGENEEEKLLQKLNVDFRYVSAPHNAKPIFENVADDGIEVDPVWGIHRKWAENESGGYWDYCEFPLLGADEEVINNWPLPKADDFDYSDIYQKCKSFGEYAIVVGHPGIGDIINSAGMLRSMQEVLVDLITNDESMLNFIDRKIDLQCEILERTIQASKGEVDLLWIGEDLGTQIGPIISMDLFRKQIRPRHQKLVDVAKKFDVPVMIHSCGSSSWAFDDFIEMGIDAVDTLQPEAKDMSPEYLKKTFGDKLAFHGCISTAGVLAYGSVDEVEQYCRNTLEIMKPGGGYCFAPTHLIQDNSPTENVVRMYEAVMKYGWY